MKIVINALQYKPNSSGIGVMIRELFGEYIETTQFPCQVILANDSPEFPQTEHTELIHSPWTYRQGIRRILFQTFQMGRRYCKDAILFTNDSKAPFFLPRSCKLVSIVTDLAIYRLPKTYQRSRVLWWKLQYRYVKSRTDLFIAISGFTKQELIDILKIPEKKIKVVPMACSENMKHIDKSATLTALREKYGLTKPYILFVGNTNPRKNLTRIIQAFDLFKGRTKLPQELVIAGGEGWKFNRDKVLEHIKYRDEVRFIGFVPDEEMPALYSASSMLVFPTLYEGFGVPVLEAQACGVPVLTSNVSALPETAGDGALFVNPYSVESICSGMIRILGNNLLSKQLVLNGYKNAMRFSWKKSAKRLDELIRLFDR